MSFYADAAEYAQQTGIPLELAQVWCAHFLETEKKIEQLRVCPKCKQSTLEYEIGCYEEGTDDRVYCDNGEVPFIDEDGEESFQDCGFSTDEVGSDYGLLSWGDFDAILYASVVDRKSFGETDVEWHKFARDTVSDICKTPKRTLEDMLKKAD